MVEYIHRVSTESSRAELFRLLGDEDRLRLLALCAEEELTVGELATLLAASQPQVTKKSQPLREAGLLAARRDGTRTLLRTLAAEHARAGRAVDPVLAAALAEGHDLCARDGSLARIASVVAQRDELSRRFFDDVAVPGEPAVELGGGAIAAWLPLLAPLLPRADLAIDVGTGEGTLLPLLSPVYQRVVAIDRSPARLARCAAKIAAWGLPNVRLREGDIDDAGLAEDVGARGGADLVVMARVLHHAARPQDAVAAAARLLREGGHLVVVDYLPHDDEAMREQGDVWLGFPPPKLRGWLEAAALECTLTPFPHPQRPPLQLAVGKKPMRAAMRHAS